MKGTTAIILAILFALIAFRYAHAQPADTRRVQPVNGRVVMVQIRDADGNATQNPMPYMFPVKPTQEIWLRTCNEELMQCSDEYLLLRVVEPD